MAKLNKLFETAKSLVIADANERANEMTESGRIEGQVDNGEIVADYEADVDVHTWREYRSDVYAYETFSEYTIKHITISVYDENEEEHIIKVA